MINKHFRKFDNNKIFFEIERYNCDKKKHIKFNCFELKIVNVIINEIFDSKNSKVSQTFHKQNKKK